MEYTIESMTDEKEEMVNRSVEQLRIVDPAAHALLEGNSNRLAKIFFECMEGELNKNTSIDAKLLRKIAKQQEKNLCMEKMIQDRISSTGLEMEKLLNENKEKLHKYYEELNQQEKTIAELQQLKDFEECALQRLEEFKMGKTDFDFETASESTHVQSNEQNMPSTSVSSSTVLEVRHEKTEQVSKKLKISPI